MGWCYEFGAQIHQGCGSPMVAAAASCTCKDCGTVCPGRFSSCRDVWDRGPQQCTVVAAPSVPDQSKSSSSSVDPPTVGRSAGPGGGSPPDPAWAPPRDGRPGSANPAQFSGATDPAAAGGLEFRLAGIEARLGALDSLVTYVQALRGTLKAEFGRLTTQAAADAAASAATTNGRLSAVEAFTSSLQTLPSRVDALSREIFEARRAAVAYDRIDRIEARLNEIDQLPMRVAALESPLVTKRSAVTGIEDYRNAHGH